MFGELPKLFDRDFAIGFFLPAAAFLALSNVVRTLLGYQPLFINVSAESFLEKFAAFGLLSLLIAIVLMVFNRGIVRLFEGYWPWKARLSWWQRRRFRKLTKEIAESDRLKKNYEENKQKFPRDLQNKRNRIKLTKAGRFPHEEHLVLPTTLGNVFRAFESYPAVMYGIDAIPAWYRLLGIVPPEYRALIDSRRASLDFWLNLSVLALILFVEYYVLAFMSETLSWRSLFLTQRFLRLPVLFLLAAWVSYRLAIRAAIEWGNWVKAAFDLYLPDLRGKLEFSNPVSPDKDRQVWESFNRAVLANEPSLMPPKQGKQTESMPLEKLWAELHKLSDSEKQTLFYALLMKREPKEAKPRDG